MNIIRSGLIALAATALGAVATASLADVTVGITLSATGPAAALGGPQKNTVALLPAELAGQKIKWIVLDDATDPTNATKNAKKLTAEDHADILIGGTTTANSLAVLNVAAETGTHRGENPFGEGVLFARAKAREQGGGQDLGRDRLVNGGVDGPAAFTGILHKSRIVIKRGIFRECGGRQVEQPGRDHAAPTPHPKLAIGGS